MSSGIFFEGKRFFPPVRDFGFVFVLFYKCQDHFQQCYFLFCVRFPGVRSGFYFTKKNEMKAGKGLSCL